LIIDLSGQTVYLIDLGSIYKRRGRKKQLALFRLSIADDRFIVGFLFVASALCKHSEDLFFLVERR
jgi:hypothetical protein